jgi:cysteine desulfurase family protein (TIGR01976 family)
MTTTSPALAERVRPHFPALQRTIRDLPVAYFDGPGGTQVPQSVADAVSGYLLHTNANDGWAYRSSIETTAALDAARAKAAAFLGAATPEAVLFGANMTTLTFHIARAFGRSLVPGDEILVTELDHHADIDPWRALERDYGAVVKFVPLLDSKPQLDLQAYERLLSPRTRLVAVGLSSNAFGTINPVARMASAARAHGALVFVDAVHAAAHGVLDVGALGADMLAFSAYKVYGPHVGVAYVREDLLERLDFPKLAPQRATGHKRGESGTLHHEGIVGTAAALDFLAGLSDGAAEDPRGRLAATMHRAASEEDAVFRGLLEGLRALPHVTLYEPPAGVPRHPTISFSIAGWDAAEVSQRLSDEHALFVSHGDFYATTAVGKIAPETLAHSGVVRAGVGLYSTAAEAARLVAALDSLAR